MIEAQSVMQSVKISAKGDVLIQRDGDAVRVILPRLERWPMLNVWFGLAFCATVIAMYHFDLNTSKWELMFYLLWAALGLCQFYFFHEADRKRRIFRIDADNVRVGFLNDSDAAEWKLLWRRDQVAEVRPDFDGNVVIRTTDGRSRRFRTGQPKEITHQIADALASAIFAKE